MAEVSQGAGCQSKTPCWIRRSAWLGFDFLLGRENTYLQLAVGSWQGPLVLESVVPVKGETYMISTSTFPRIWQLPCFPGCKRIAIMLVWGPGNAEQPSLGTDRKRWVVGAPRRPAGLSRMGS